MTTDDPLHGFVAQRITSASDSSSNAAITSTSDSSSNDAGNGGAAVGVANRGYNEEGLSLAEGVGKPWEG